MKENINIGLQSMLQTRKKKAGNRRMALLAVITFIALAAAFLLPAVLVGTAENVTVVFPQSSYKSSEIYVDGVVEEQEKKDITLQIPIVPEEVLVSVGDSVKINELIATVDTGATGAALFSLAESANAIPAEYLETFAGIADAAGISSIAVGQGVIENNIPTEIKSPINGVVTSISLVRGAVTAPRSSVCTISRLDELRLHMNIGEAEADMVKPGDTVVFKATATGEEKYTGTVTKIFPSASKVLAGTTQKTVVGMYVKPDNDNRDLQSGDLQFGDLQSGGLKPGYSVTGAVRKDTGEKMLTIPYDVILQDDSNVEYVYCYENGNAVRVDIVTGEELVNMVEVISGLTEQSAVIKNGNDIKELNQAVRLEE